MLRSFTDVLALWTPLQFSRAMGLRYGTAVAMYARDSIGSAHWSRLIEVTTARGEILTAEMLIQFRDINVAKTRDRIAARRRGRTRSKSQSLALPVP